MFFNYCCKRPCCRCERCDRKEKNYFDIKDKYDYDKCNNHNYDKHDKCEKRERCCCHINVEKKCSCDKNECKHFDKNDRNFDDRTYYGEYNNLGSFGYNNMEYDYEQNSRQSYSKENDRKDYDKENNRKYYDDENDFVYKSYTPNWDNDTNCKCEKDDKHSWDNKCCKPVKYICIPCDKY